MRDFKGMKRQRGRNRTGGAPQTSNAGKPGQNANRAFDSNGPDNVKVRGHAQHVYEKYQQLARDAAAAGDPVLAENYLQHGEHYFRTLRVLQPNRPVTDIVNRDSFASGFDLDFEDAAVESAMEQADAGAAAGEAQAPMQAAEPEAEVRQDRYQRPNYERSSFDGRQDRNYNGDRQNRDFNGDRQNNNSDRSSNDRDRQTGERTFNNDRSQGERQNNTNDRQNGDRQNGDRQQTDRQNNDRQSADRQGGDRQNQGQDRPYNDRQSGERSNGERSRYEARSDRPRERSNEDRANPRFERQDRVEPVAEPEQAPAAMEADASPMLRSVDGGVSEAPAFLAAAPASPAPTLAAPEEDAERRPRARRTRRPRTDDATATTPESEDA